MRDDPTRLRCDKCGDISVLYGPVGLGEEHQGCGGYYRLVNTRTAPPLKKEMRLSREATLWNVEGDVEQVPNATEFLKYIYQALPTYAPQDAEPFCCYLKTVIFYEGRQWGSAAKEITRCDHYDLACAPSPHLVFFKGLWYEVGGGNVLWRNDEWQFRFTLDARTRHARLLNLGATALRAFEGKPV